MDTQDFRWLSVGMRRQKVLVHLRQPMTARQVAGHADLSLSRCSRALGELARREALTCLNEPAWQSRIYWLTELGRHWQAHVRNHLGLQPLVHDFPEVDWHLYGWVCFRHRSAVLKTMNEPMQAVHIRRTARQQNPRVRMSANNVRDVLRLFVDRSIARKVWVRRKAHPRFELTETGTKLRELLVRIDRPARVWW